jgi:hypothetical protein
MYGDAEDYQSDEAAAKLVFDFVEKAEKALEPLHKQWRRNEMLYWSRLDKDMWPKAMGASQWQSGSPYKSAICLPIVLQQVETQVPKLATSLLANDPMWRARALIRDGEMAQQAEAEMQAEAKERWLHHQCVRDVKIRRRLAPWLRSAVLHGTKMLFADWVTRRGPDWSMVPKTTKASNGEIVGTGVWELKEQPGVVLEDRIRVTGHAPWDVFPDPRGQTFRGEDGRVCRGVARQLIMDIDDLIGWIKGMDAKPWWYKRGKGGKLGKTPADSVWIAELKELQGQVKGEHNKTASIMADVGRLASDQGEGWMATEKDKKLLRVLDYWEPVGGWHVMVVGTKGKGICLLREPNPLKKLGLPFIALCPVPLDNQLYGLGIVDMGEHLIHVANALTNLHMTGAIHEANPIIIVDSMSGLNADEMMATPYLFKNVDGNVPLKECVHIQPFPATTATVFQEREFVLKQGESAMGASEFSMSGDPGNNQTARGIQQFVQQNAQRFTQAALQTGECLCQLGEAMDLLNQQYITGPKQLRYSRPKGKDRYTTITPEMIARPIDLEFDARPEVANPDLRAQQFLQWLGIVREWPNFDMDEAIVESAKLLRISRPPRFLKAQFSRAEMENEMFRQSVRAGQPYFGQVLPNDPHAEHEQIHGLVFEDGTIEQGGEAAKRVAVEHLVRHIQVRETAGAQAQQAQEAQVG